MMTEVGAAALEYARRGWPVFPLWWPASGLKRCACTKDPTCGTSDAAGKLLGSPAKHPITAHGLDDASVDPAVITAWWSKWPNANVGVRTGVVFDVLDIDSAPAGRALAVAADLAGEDTGECWGRGPMSDTAHGQHLLFELTGAPSRTGLVVPNVDWRGVGGYIVAPPSVHVSGHMYSWRDGCGPDTPLPLAPAFLVAALFRLTAPPPQHGDRRASTASPEAAIAGLARSVATAASGTRNATLNWAAFTLAGKVARSEVSQRDGVSGCDALLAAAISVGLSESEAEATIRSGWKAGISGRVAQ